MVDHLRIHLSYLLKDEILIEERQLFFLFRHDWNVSQVAMFHHVIIEKFKVAYSGQVQAGQLDRGFKAVLFHAGNEIRKLDQVFFKVLVDGFLIDLNAEANRSSGFFKLGCVVFFGNAPDFLRVLSFDFMVKCNRFFFRFVFQKVEHFDTVIASSREIATHLDGIRAIFHESM